MADFRRVLPEEAQELLAQGYVYIDVRTEPEFEQGHIPGALNVPLMQRSPGGLRPNSEFSSVMEACFGKTDRLLVGCRTGSRSLKAAQVLVAAGFTEVIELKTGFEGSRDPFGRLEPGWSKKGLPVETGAPAGQSYEDVKKRGAG